MDTPEQFVGRPLAIRGRVVSEGCPRDIGEVDYYFELGDRFEAVYGNAIVPALVELEMLGGPVCCPAYRVPTRVDGTSSDEVVAIGELRFDDSDQKFRLDARSVCTLADGP